jgi:hypothetical protein
MSTATQVFEIERQGPALLVTALSNLLETAYQEIEAEAQEVLHLLENGTIQNVVLDFYRIDYYVSRALGFFVKLWKRVRERGEWRSILAAEMTKEARHKHRGVEPREMFRKEG